MSDGRISRLHIGHAVERQTFRGGTAFALDRASRGDHAAAARSAAPATAHTRTAPGPEVRRPFLTQLLDHSVSVAGASCGSAAAGAARSTGGASGTRFGLASP